MLDIIYALIFGVIFYFLLKWLNNKGKVNTKEGKLTIEQQGVIAAWLFYLFNSVLF